MLMNNGKDEILELVTAKDDAPIVQIRLGTDSTAAAATQTALGTQILSATASSVLDSSAHTIRFTAVFQSTGATMREVGLFNSDAVMFFRQVIAATSFTSGTDFVVEVVVTIS